MLRAFYAGVLCAVGLVAQSEVPLLIGRPVTMLAAAAGGARGPIVFGAALTPEGATLPTMDLYVVAADGSGLRRLTRLASSGGPPQGATVVSVSTDGMRAAFTALLLSANRSSEEVHVVDVASGTDHTVAVDTQGCIQPLCANCLFTCVNTPHISADGATVLYSVRRSKPFYTVRGDGGGLAQLPVYSGVLAPAPQRVISRNGLVAFSSSAPLGPTFAASAQDVYVMNLDGSNIRAVTKFGLDASLYSMNATISADGGVIAFESNRDPETGKAGKNSQIWVVRADGSGLRAVTTGSEPSTSPTLSADGSLVALVRSGQIYTVRSDGTGLRALTGFKMSSAQDPVFSEDGSLVVFSLGPREGGRGAVYAVNNDGGNLRPVYAPRSLNQGGVGGIAGWGVDPAASPGGLISAYGTNLSTDALTIAPGFPLPQSLAGVSLLVNGVPAPLLAASPWQVNAQVPPETAEGPASFQFRFADGALTTAGAVEVKLFAPAIFSWFSESLCQAAVLHSGTGVPADDEHPAQAGETLEIYGTGLGPTDPFVPAGVPAPASVLARASTPEVLIGGKTAGVEFAGLTPGLVGVYQVNATVPSGLRPGRHMVSWRIRGITSNGCGTIAVR